MRGKCLKEIVFFAGQLIRVLGSSRGQVIAEIALILPVFLFALFLSISVFVFISESARAERVANEIVRELYQTGGNVSQEKCNEIAYKTLNQNKMKRYTASMVVYKSPTTHIPNRCRIELFLESRALSNQYLRSTSRFNPTLIKKVKKFYTSGWSAGAVY